MKLETVKFTVPEEAIAFLVAVGACLLLLMIFYIFITKQFCFSKKSSSDRNSQQLDDTEE